MNKMRFLAFAIFISLFSFVSSMSKTKEKIKIEEREITKERLIKAIKSLDVKVVERYSEEHKSKGRDMTSEEFYALRKILDENWKWIRTCSDFREKISLLIWTINGSILPPAIIGFLLGRLAKQVWFKRLLITHNLKVDFFEVCGKTGYYCFVTASALAPISVVLYYLWETHGNYSRLGSLLFEMKN